MNFYKNESKGAIHKRCHQSRRFYSISLFSKNDDKGGGGQKSQKIDDVFYERPQVFWD